MMPALSTPTPRGSHAAGVPFPTLPNPPDLLGPLLDVPQPPHTPSHAIGTIMGAATPEVQTPMTIIEAGRTLAKTQTEALPSMAKITQLKPVVHQVQLALFPVGESCKEMIITEASKPAKVTKALSKVLTGVCEIIKTRWQVEQVLVNGPKSIVPIRDGNHSCGYNGGFKLTVREDGSNPG